MAVQLAYGEEGVMLGAMTPCGGCGRPMIDHQPGDCEMPPVRTEEIEMSELIVVQADRDAAVPFANGWERRGFGTMSHQTLIRSGELDSDPLVQAFARHRTRSPDAVREALELALEPLALLAGGVNMNDPLSKWFTVAQLFAARDALEAAAKEGGK